MENLIIYEKPSFKTPRMVLGFSGWMNGGNVSTGSVEYLRNKLKAKKFAEIYSKDFPPQVFINTDGTIKLVNNEFYYWKAKKKNQRDLILLTGDYQGLSSQGQYELVENILNDKLDVYQREEFNIDKNYNKIGCEKLANIAIMFDKDRAFRCPKHFR